MKIGGIKVLFFLNLGNCLRNFLRVLNEHPGSNSQKCNSRTTTGGEISLVLVPDFEHKNFIGVY